VSRRPTEKNTKRRERKKQDAEDSGGFASGIIHLSQIMGPAPQTDRQPCFFFLKIFGTLISSKRKKNIGTSLSVAIGG